MSQSSTVFATFTESSERLLIKEVNVSGSITENERRLGLALEAAFMILFEWDIVHNRVTRFVSANPCLPTENGPLTVQGVRDVVHPDDRELFMVNLQRAIDEPDGPYQSEFRYVLADGTTIWASEYGYVERDTEGRALRLTGLSQDITHRKLIFRALQEERDRLHALISSIHDEVWLADTHGKFTLANPSACQGFNLQSDGTDIDIRDLAASLEVLRPDGSLGPIEEAPPLRSLRGEVVSNQEEIIRMPVSGQLRYRQVNAGPIRNPAGEIVGAVSVVRDITENKQAEQRLREAKQAAQKAKARLADFAKTQNHAVENERRRIAREVHDQIGQVFTAIRIIIGTLPEGSLPKESMDALAQALNIGITSTRRITSELRPPLLDDLGLAAALQEHLKPLFVDNLGTLVIDICNDNMLSRPLALSLFRIAQEATANALRHAQARKISFYGHLEGGGYYSFAIVDDGVGFDVSNVTTGTHGLINMQERAAMIGGECKIESKVNQGTVVTVRCPLVDHSQ